MSVQVYLQLTAAYLLWTVYILSHLLYRGGQYIYYRYSGLNSQIQDCVKPDNYKKSAEVRKVVFKHRLDDFLVGSELDFVTVHERFDNPQVLLGDDYTLYSFTKTHAIFVEAEKSWAQPLHHYDFYILGQYASAVKVVKLPLNQFHKLAEETESDGGKVVFLQNQARCGGTLLTAVFKDSGRCVCFNEPHAFTTLCRQIFSDNIYHGDDAKRMYRNGVKMLCKPYRRLEGGQPVLAYVIKPTVLNIIATEMTQDVFPGCVQLFMYRDPRAIAVSIRRIGQVLNTLKLMFYLPNIPHSVAFLVHFIGYPDNDFRGWTASHHVTLEFGYRLACLSMFHYQKALKHGVNIHGLRYSDLVANKKKLIRDVFNVCQLPESLVERGEAALDKDSQANSPISMEILKRVIPNPPKITPEFLEVARAMSKEWGVPGPDGWDDKTLRLPNTLLP